MWPFGGTQKFLYRVRYNGVVVFSKLEKVTPKAAWFRKKSHTAYLIPSNAQPVRDGDHHVFEYNQEDAYPLADLMDVIPDQIKEIEPMIAEAVISGIDSKVEDMTQKGEMMSNEQADLYNRVAIWMQQYQGTTLIYQLWRWGYFKGERWYRDLKALDREKIDTVCFPKKLARAGVIPLWEFERVKSTMVVDIVKRPEPKWAWLEPYIPWICVTAFAMLALYYAFTVFHL